jgi:hypothetical protein
MHACLRWWHLLVFLLTTLKTVPFCSACRPHCVQLCAALRSQQTSPAPPATTAADSAELNLCCAQLRQQASQVCMQSPQLLQQQGWVTGLALTANLVLPACAVQLVTAAGQQRMELCVVRLAAACQQRPAGCLLWVLQCCWGSRQMLLGAARRCQQQVACCWSGRWADSTTVGCTVFAK